MQHQSLTACGVQDMNEPPAAEDVAERSIVLLDMRVICMDISIGRRGLSSVEIGAPVCLSSTRA